MRRLADAAWPAVAERAASTIVAVPVGSTEQHGPHLPIGTDTMVATELCVRLASARPDVVVAPALPYGSAGEHAAFAGSLSIGQAALERVIVELVRSADAFAGVVLVSGHGGNAAALASASDLLRSEGRRVLTWSPSVPGGDAHAGRTETSLVLALRGELVGDPEPGNVAPLRELMPALRSGGVAAVAPNGVLGDPTGASADEGRALLDSLVADLVAAVSEWAA